MTIQFVNAQDQSKLNPHLAQDYVGELKTCKRWSALWKVAALISLVAFTALAATATAFTYLTAPMYLPILFTAVLACCLSPAYRFFEWMWKTKAGSYREKAEMLEPVAKEVEKLLAHGKNPATSLLSFNITTIHSSKIKEKDLIPLIARYNALNQQLLKVSARVNILTNELFKNKKFTAPFIKGKDIEEREINLTQEGSRASLASNPNSLSVYYSIQAKFEELRYLQETLIAGKIQQAFLLHVISHPHDARSLEGHCTLLGILSPAAKEVFSQLGDPNINTFALRKDTQKHYSREDLESKTIPQISKELFAS